MKITLHPEAEHDLHVAAAFYEREGSPLLAARFVAEFKRMAALLAEQPEIGAPRTRGRRGFAMSIFPYTLIDKVSGEEIKILVVKHDSRRPGYGGGRS
jgi:plasmid stabilization system protein ParE